MATQSLVDQVLTSAWVDLTVALPAIVSLDVTLQNVGNGPVAISFGTDPSAGNISGLILGPRENVGGNAANIYAKSLEASGRLSVTLT